MSEALLTLLRWCLLALVYLFFFRVLQATWFGSTTNVAVKRVGARVRSGSSGASAPPEAHSLVIVAPVSDAGRYYEVMGEMTIGRAAGCQITLEDTYISQLHARVAPAEQGLVIEDLGSTNGTFLNQQRVTTPVLGRIGDHLQLGGVVLELR